MPHHIVKTFDEDLDQLGRKIGGDGPFGSKKDRHCAETLGAGGLTAALRCTRRWYRS
jgi:hypothetical protein